MGRGLNRLVLGHNWSMRRIGWVVGIASLVLAGASTVGWVQPVQAAPASYPPIPSTIAVVPPACAAPTDIPAVPSGQVQTIEQEVTVLVGDHFQGLGQCGYGLLVLTLTPGSEPMAQEVRAMFGPCVQIMVGLTVWNGHPGRSPRCGTLANPSLVPAKYSATLDLRSRRINVGGNLKGVVVFRDTSPQRIQLSWESSNEIVITKPGTRRVVGVLSGAVAGTGMALSLSPHQTQSVGIVGGTARCDGGVGSALPAGHYDAVAEVSGAGVDGPAGTGHGASPTYFTQFVPIQIIRS